MRWFHKLPLRLQSLFRRSRVERELSDELRYHLEESVAEAVAKGKTPEEARYAALQELGGVERIKEECRDMRRVKLIETLAQDLRYGLRMLAKNPGFTAVAAITIALGIASTTIAFSVVNAVVFQPLRYGHPERMALVWAAEPRGDFTNPPEPVYLAWRDRATAFESLAALADTSFDLRGNPPVRLGAAQATANFFRVVDVQPELGRAFTEEEARNGARVLVLSHSVWKNEFASDGKILGQTVVLNGAPWTVIGVMPASFSFVRNDDLWVPLELTADLPVTHSSLLVVGRLRPGISLDQANAQLQNLQKQIAAELPQVAASGLTSARVMPLKQFLLGANVTHMMSVLLGAVAFVLLIACSNVANLLLARGTARQKEIAMRLSLGASRRRVVRQLLTETGQLAVIGAAVGLLVAAAAVRYIARLPVLQAPGASPVSVDAAVLAFSMGITCLTTLVCGLGPAWRVSQVQLTESLKAAIGADRHRRLRASLVVVEMALSVVLLAGAGLLVRSFVNLLRVNPGFDPSDLLTMDVSLSRYQTPAAIRGFYHQALERVRALPGVQDADLCTTLPLIGWNYGIPFRSEHQPKDALQRQNANLQVVTEDYFRTTGLPMVGGRSFTAQDTAASLPVAIINRHLARRLFKDQNPVGQRLIVSSPLDRGGEVVRQVVGVAADMKDNSLNDPASDDIYLPYEQSPAPWEYMVVRSRMKPAALIPSIRAAIAAVDRDQPIEDIATMQERLNQSLSGPRFAVALLGAFALLALALAAVGIYGVMSYIAGRRLSEFGLRMALGARPVELVRLLLWSGLRLALAGCAIGVAGALVFARVMSSAVFGISPRDPLTFTLALAIILAAAVLAIALPARRAARVDPIVALRYE